MNNQEWLTFWKQVQSDFQNSEELYFCDVSNLFRIEWSQHLENPFAQLAREFLEEKKIVIWESKVLSFVLFAPLETVCDEDRRNIRLQFLEWIINKLENGTN